VMTRFRHQHQVLMYFSLDRGKKKAIV
jgi:hypothetical protein